MFLFVSVDGDKIGRMIGQLAQQDDEEGVRRISQAIDSGNEIWKSWALKSLGAVISMGGDEARMKVPPDALEDLPQIQSQYEGAVGASVSVGVGTRMREADRALLAAKIRGGSQICLYAPEIEEELEKITPQTEAEKLSDEYLTKSFAQAGFKNLVTGEVRGTGAVHDLYWDDSTQTSWEPGFIRKSGEFVSSASLRKDEPPKPISQPPENSPAGGGGFKGRSEPGQEAAPTSPMGEASEHSQGEAALAAAAEQPVQEGTHGAEDFERELHGHATQADQADQQANAQEDDLTKAKKRVVELLTQVKQQAPVIEQLKQQAPEVYQAIQGAVESVILLGRALMSAQPQQAPEQDQGQPQAQGEQPVQKDEEPLEKKVVLPVGSSKDGKVKVHHGDTGKDGWVSVRSGQVLSNDNHTISSRNAGGR